MASLNEQNLLTLSYLDREPLSAARVLESIGASDAAAFFNRAPARIVAPAVAAMIPWSSASCVKRMKPEKASGLLRAMGYSDAVSILRLMEADERERLLSFSTKRFARSFRNSLAYPQETVGAWMDVGVPTFQESTQIGDVVRALKRSPFVESHLFVINGEKRFFGVVPVAEILRHHESTTLESLADRSLKPLSNRDSLRSCEARADWDHLLLLPVIGRKQNFLGALSRASLRKALRSGNGKVISANPGSVVMQLLTIIPVVGLAFADLAMAQADGSPPSGKRGKSHGR